jgi:hypothetical protein
MRRRDLIILLGCVAAWPLTRRQPRSNQFEHLGLSVIGKVV